MGVFLTTTDQDRWAAADILAKYTADRRLGNTPIEAAAYLRNLYANTTTYELTRWGADVAEYARARWEQADRLYSAVRLRQLAMGYWSTGRVTFMPASLDRSLAGGR